MSSTHEVTQLLGEWASGNLLREVTLAAARRSHHEDFHALGRKVENLFELLVNLAVHPDGGLVCNPDNAFLYFRLQLTQTGSEIDDCLARGLIVSTRPAQSAAESDLECGP
jgi:hypothetical protein